jgi:hypothetical protein
LNWHNVAVGSEVDPGMVVEVVEAVLMAEDGVEAAVVGNTSQILEFPNFLAFSCPGLNSWSLVFEEAQKITHRYLDRDHFKKFVSPSQYCAFQ